MLVNKKWATHKNRGSIPERANVVGGNGFLW